MNIGLLGCGVVGSGVKEIIDAMKDDIKISKILVKDLNEITDERKTISIDDLLSPDIDLIVECIGGIDIPFNYITRALNAKKNVVTSNKKVMATHYENLINLAQKNSVSLAFEASVGGGIPWIENIRHTKKVDKITSFEGIFNGTTNYILDSMTTQGKDFDAVLKEAQNLGYAESNPSDDIDGYDVRYKCCLSANVIWDTSLNLNDILYFGIRNIAKKDIDFALKNNMTLKLIGKANKNEKNINILIIPSFIKNNENISHISKNLNCTKLNSEYLGESSYIGQGAGKYPTAHAVVQDIISIYENRNIMPKISEKLEVNNEYSGNFYIRSDNIEKFQDFILEKIDIDSIITKVVNLKEIKNLVNKNTFIAEIKL